MHDGRAQTIDAAINSHAGEAIQARNRFQTLAPADRDALLDFVRNL
jgi:CxxC motif-containing protein (DUF1111 family)